MIDLLPQIPDDDTPVEVIQKTQEKVTLNDLPPPGALLQRQLTDRELDFLVFSAKGYVDLKNRYMSSKS